MTIIEVEEGKFETNDSNREETLNHILEEAESGCDKIIGYMGNVNIRCGRNECEDKIVNDVKVRLCKECQFNKEVFHTPNKTKNGREKKSNVYK